LVVPRFEGDTFPT